MSLSHGKVAVWCAALAMAACAGQGGSFAAFVKHASHGTAARGLGKTAALVWKQTGSTVYDNMGTQSAPVWTLSSRDTTMYDAAGNQIVYMSSSAQSGWSLDSLTQLDSTIYANGKIVASVNRTLSNSLGTVATIYGSRATYSYPAGGNALLETGYDWDATAATWIPSGKDSIVSTTLANGADWMSNLTGLTALYAWNYDTTSHSWTTAQILTKTTAECTPTKLVLGGQRLFSGDVSLVDVKIQLTFTSSQWSFTNQQEEIDQRDDPVTGNLVNANRSVYAINASGYLTEEDDYTWDATNSVWAASDKYLYFPDAHGNDTLSIELNYNDLTTSWDTSRAARYARTYDANGNNTQELYSYYSSLNAGWQLSTKTVRTFAQINSPVIHAVQPASPRDISMTAAPGLIRFSARDITGVSIYDAAGRVVLCVKQRPADELVLKGANGAASLPAGGYLSELRTAAGNCSFRLPVCR